MAHKIAIGGTAYSTAGGRIMAAGTAWSVVKGRTMVGGTVWDIPFSSERMIKSLPVGSSVFCVEDGALAEFIVVHQGNPDPSVYDESCDGSWLMRSRIFQESAWGDRVQNYEKTALHKIFTGSYKERFGESFLSCVKTVKIPYTDSYSSVKSGADGLETNFFALSTYEVGGTSGMTSSVPVVGSCLAFFEGAEFEDARRIAYDENGAAVSWWTRDRSTSTGQYSIVVWDTGEFSRTAMSVAYGVRPAMIVYGDVLVDENNMIIT